MPKVLKLQKIIERCFDSVDLWDVPVGKKLWRKKNFAHTVSYLD